MRGEAAETGKLSQSSGRTLTATNKNTSIHGISHILRRQLREEKDIRTGGELKRDVIWGGRFLRRAWTGSFAPPRAVEAAAHHVAQTARGSQLQQ